MYLGYLLKIHQVTNLGEKKKESQDSIWQGHLAINRCFLLLFIVIVIVVTVIL